MSIRARISKSYRWRIGIVGIAALAFAAYCYYDGSIAYPAKKAKWDAFIEIVDPDGDKEYIDNWDVVWEEHATEKGWATDTPKELNDMDIMTQFIMGAICTVVGLFFFISFLMMGRRFVEVDDESISDYKGNRATWDEVTDIDDSRWGTKGIGVVLFDNGSGTKRIVLDDWKYDNLETKQIMAQVVTKTGIGSDDKPDDAGEDTEPSADADASDESAETTDPDKAPTA